MWYFLAFVAAAAMTAMKWRLFWDAKNEKLNIPSMLTQFGTRLVILAIPATALEAVVIVPAGHRGVVFDSVKGVRPIPLVEGLNFRIPFVQEVVLLDVRVQKEEFEATAASKDLQDVNAQVAVTTRLNEKTVADLYQKVGLDYAEKIIHPAVQETLKAVTAKYTAEELITKREEVKGKIHDQLVTALGRFDITLTETYITNFKFGTAFANAIEQKQVAAQEVMTAENKLRQVEVEAKQQIAKYKAEAEGIRMKREAISPEMLKLEWIRAWNGVLPQIYSGGPGGLMSMMNLGNMSSYESKPKTLAQREAANGGTAGSVASAPRPVSDAEKQAKGENTEEKSE